MLAFEVFSAESVLMARFETILRLPKIART
jgi:hypothetical protein